jgi:hypothetical protein
MVQDEKGEVLWFLVVRVSSPNIAKVSWSLSLWLGSVYRNSGA